MKKILNFIVIMTLLLFLTPITETNEKEIEKKTATRQGVAQINNSKYFDYYEEDLNEKEYRVFAKKKFANTLSSTLEQVSLFDNSNIICYELVATAETKTVNLKVYNENSDKETTSEFKGFICTNYNNKPDILFNGNGEKFFLSELETFTDVEKCSVFGNILHKTINAAMLVLSYVEPAIHIIVDSGYFAISWIYKQCKNAVYNLNYSYNKELSQPEDYIYSQRAYSDWRFGFTNMSKVGCEVVAGYNMARAKNVNITLAETILAYETLGIEFGFAKGFFGSNPYQISYFLDATKIRYNKVYSYKTFERLMKNKQNYYIILSSWNDENISSAIHTFFIEKDVNRNERFKAYNFGSNKSAEIYKITFNTDYYSNFFECKINKTFICAYFVLL